METLQYRIADIPAVADRILAEGPRRSARGADAGARAFALTGEVGSGKTTLVAALCHRLGVTTPVSSPTYGIVHEYAGRDARVYHLDAYRLESLAEALDAGLEEILAAEDAWVFVEWPEIIEPLLPPGVVFLRLSYDPEDGDRRQLIISSATTPTDL